MSRREGVREGIAGALDAWSSPKSQPAETVAPKPKPKASSAAKPDPKPKPKAKKKKTSSKEQRDPSLGKQPAGFVERAGEPRHRITAYLHPEMAKRLRLFAAGEAVGMSVVISAALEEYLERHGA